MSQFFLWVRKRGGLPAEDLEAVKTAFTRSSDKVSIDITGGMHGVIVAEGALAEDDGRIRYSAQTGTGIYSTFGPNVFLPNNLNRLEGLWIFVEVDSLTSSITLARDRFAGMPLYLYEDHENFILSSHIKHIRTALPGRCPVSLSNLAGLLSSLLPPHFGEETLFEHILIPKGGYLYRFNLSTGRKESFSYLEASPRQELWQSPAEQEMGSAVRQLRKSVKDAVERNFTDNKTTALALSGGVDSSVLAVELRNAEIPFKAFSVTYPECYGQAPDERENVRLTAKRLGIKVKWVDIEGRNYLDCVDELTLLHEEPLSTPGLPVAYLQEKFMREEGFDSVTSGLAGDSLFGGLAALWLGALFIKNPGISWNNWKLWRSSVPVSAFASGVLTFISPVSKKILERLRNRRYAKAPWLKITPRVPEWYGCDGCTYQLYRIKHETEEILPLLLEWEERRCAFLGLEPILPFIDLECFRNLETLPASFRFHDGWSKYLVRRTYSQALPSKVIWGRRKLGFDVPLDLWMSGMWRKKVKETVLASSLLSDIVDKKWIEARFDSLPPILLWRLYATARFMELF